MPKRRAASINRPPFLRRSSQVLLSLCVGVSMACAKTTEAFVVVHADPQQQTSTRDIVQEMGQSAVVYLGERHDSVADHQAQLEIIQALHQKNPKLAIALEMFQRPFQPVLDHYIAGEIDEGELVEQSQYLQRWGFPWELYAPILRFAREHQLPVLALNTPSEISHKIARVGLDGLSPEDLTYIPDPDEIDTQDQAYREYVGQAFGGHGAHGKFNFDNFFAAQVTWDETMAEAIANFKQNNLDHQVVVLAGQGHVIYGYGIPNRVQRRLGESLTQTIVLLNPAVKPQDEAIADVIWYSQPQTAPQ